MKESFRLRAIENIESAQLLFKEQKYNASANRAYYAAFHLAVYKLNLQNIETIPNHKAVQSLFADLYFNRKKIYPSIYKRYLTELQMVRNAADYYFEGISKKQAAKQLKMAIEFFEIIGSEK